MRYEVVLSPEAVEDLGRLSARNRALVRDAIERHLRYEPAHEGLSRIKRLRGIDQPQYRLRVGEIRVFYDIGIGAVEVLAIVAKAQASAWLDRYGGK